MPGQQEAFQGRQPIVDRLGELVGYDLLCRASGSAERACVDDEDAASLQVMSTLLHDLGAPAVLAGRQAFDNVGLQSLREALCTDLTISSRTLVPAHRSAQAAAQEAALA
jgi:c-di-GMP-related signal transduction protein